MYESMPEPSAIKKTLSRLQEVREISLDSEGSTTREEMAAFYRGYRAGADHAITIVIEELVD